MSFTLTPAKIIVVGPSWVGDMVMAHSLLQVLQLQHPGCHIDVLAPAWSLGLLQRMPEVHTGISMPLGHGQFGFSVRRTLGKQLATAGYTQAIVLPNSWKSALIPWFAAIPLRTGFLGECRWGLLNDARSLDKQQLRMTVQRFVALGLPPGQIPTHYPLPRLHISAAQQQQVCQQFQLKLDAPILALCPGAEYGPAKQWPAQHYAAVARQQIAQGRQVWLLGSAKDQAIAQEINAATQQQCRDFTGSTTLTEAIDLLSLAERVISNDSGLMHVAAALHKPLLALYGSSDPGFTPPLNAQATILKLDLPCAPCFKRSCPLGHTQCLTQLSPEQILAHLP